RRWPRGALFATETPGGGVAPGEAKRPRAAGHGRPLARRRRAGRQGRRGSSRQGRRGAGGGGGGARGGGGRGGEVAGGGRAPVRPTSPAGRAFPSAALGVAAEAFADCEEGTDEDTGQQGKRPRGRPRKAPAVGQGTPAADKATSAPPGGKKVAE